MISRQDQCGLFLAVTMFVTAVCFSSARADDPVEAPPVEVTTGFDYEVDGKPYHLTFRPSDRKSEALIRKYRMFTLHHSLGSVLRAGNTEIADSNVKHIIYDDTMIVRDSYTQMTDETFEQLVKGAASQFRDLKYVDWGAVKIGLDTMGWMHPILDEKTGEISDDKFMLHDVIVEHWKVKE